MGVAVGALAVVGVGFVPGAAASDEQSKQWYLDPMKADQMWKVSTGKGVKVAVIDTGVNPDTASLKGQVLADEVPKAVSYHATIDYEGHGTSMAELIAGTGADGGVKGLAPGAKIVPYRIKLEGLKGAEEKQKTPEPADAIRAAADTDVKIINMSFGSDYVDPDEEAAIKYAASKGKLMIAAVGNAGEAKGHVGYPAAYPYVLGVSAMDKTGTVSKFSSYGGYVDLTAPGEAIPGWCDANFRSYCDGRQGTSPAAAIASAAAALVWSAHPDWTVNQVTRALIDTAGRDWPKDDPSSYLGYGAVRPREVLDNAGYDAGPANIDPLAKENGGDLLAKSSTVSSSSSTPSPSPSSQAPQKTSTGGTSAAESSSNSDSNSLWIAITAAAAVILIGGAAAAVVRARRAR
ncbi:S8 family serine peptidase [Streptomyces xylophagus]|uniref:S8 family serine peptidase n=1 Tax=Streptomyces xylophagus TaxID=285514 RepID=UPI00068AC38A|nr:S8 family serine peptidase [Streptomyces xylophagus]